MLSPDQLFIDNLPEELLLEIGKQSPDLTREALARLMAAEIAEAETVRNRLHALLQIQGRLPTGTILTHKQIAQVPLWALVRTTPNTDITQQARCLEIFDLRTGMKGMKLFSQAVAYMTSGIDPINLVLMQMTYPDPKTKPKRAAQVVLSTTSQDPDEKGETLLATLIPAEELGDMTQHVSDLLKKLTPPDHRIKEPLQSKTATICNTSWRFERI